MEYLAHLLGLCPCRFAHLDFTDLLLLVPFVGLFIFKAKSFFKR
jgi:hypothetical protein